MKQQKTFMLPAAILSKWLEALRSGKYKQGVNSLEAGHPDGEMRYCCLGVLQKVVDGKVETYNSGESCNLPSTDWAERVGMKSTDFGSIATRNPALHVLGQRVHTESCSSANDHLGLSFPEIADAIELSCQPY